MVTAFETMFFLVHTISRRGSYSDDEEEWEEENYEIIVQEKYCWGFFVGECFMTFFPPFPNHVIAHQIFTILF